MRDNDSSSPRLTVRYCWIFFVAGVQAFLESKGIPGSPDVAENDDVFTSRRELSSNGPQPTKNSKRIQS